MSSDNPSTSTNDSSMIEPQENGTETTVVVDHEQVAKHQVEQHKATLEVLRETEASIVEVSETLAVARRRLEEHRARYEERAHVPD